METSYTGKVPLMAQYPRKQAVATPSANQEMQVKTKISDLRLQLIHKLNEPYWRKGKIEIGRVKPICIEIVYLDWVPLVTFVFACVDFPHLLKENEEACTDTKTMKEIRDAIMLLFRYAVNLLKQEQHSLNTNWRVISFDNSVYQVKVKTLKGHERIFKQLGYTKVMPYGLSYPDASLEPNTETVIKVAADLAVIFYECECYISGEHPYPDRIWKLLKSRKSPHPGGDIMPRSPQLKVDQMQSTPSSGYGSFENDERNDQLKTDEKLNQSRQIPTHPATIPEESNNFFSPITTEITDRSCRVNPDNEQWLTPPTSPKTIKEVKLSQCGLCKQNLANMRCDMCSQPRCKRCDELWHKHPSRRSHKRQEVSTNLAAEAQPEPSKKPAQSDQVKSSSSADKGAHSEVPVSHSKHNDATLAATAHDRVADTNRLSTEHLSDLISPISPTRPRDKREIEPLSFKSKSLKTHKDCGFCEAMPGRVRCLDCKEVYCEDCDTKRHRSDVRKNHRRHDLIQTYQAESHSNSQMTESDETEEFVLSPDVALDSITSPSIGAEYKSAMSFSNMDEELDIRAPPTDRYSAPSMQPPQAQRMSREIAYRPETTQRETSYRFEQPKLRAPSFFKAPGSDQAPPDAVQTQEARKKATLEAEINKIVAEDIDILEALNSFRELKRDEPDPARRVQLEKDEHEYWQKHLHLLEQQDRLKEQLSGNSERKRPQEHVPQRRAVDSPPVDEASQKVSSPNLVPSPGRSPSPSAVSGHSRPLSNTSGVGMATSQGPPSQDMRSQYFSTRTIPDQVLGSSPPSSSAEGWTCEHCTFLNTDVTTNICNICNKTSKRKLVMKPSVRPKEPSVEKVVKTGSTSAGDSQPSAATTELPRKQKRVEYFQQLEAEMLAEKQKAKDMFKENVAAPEPELKKPEVHIRKEEPVSSPLSDGELLKLAQNVPAEKFMELGIDLGFRYTFVNHLQKSSPDRGTFEMLMMWRDKTRGKDQRQMLKQILREAELGGLAAKMEETSISKDPPIPKESAALTDKDILQLANRIPNNMCDLLGMYLGFDGQRIEECLRDHRGGAHRLLLDWKVKTKGSDQRSDLNKVLKLLGIDELELDEVVEVKEEVTDPLSEFELYELAESLNAEKVMLLGMFLGFSPKEITRYQTSVMLPRDGTIKMLFVWRERQERDSERRILCRVLSEMGCAQLAEQLKAHGGGVGLPNFGSPPSPRPRTPLSPVGGTKLAPAASISDMSYVHDEEKKRYEELRIDSLGLIAILRDAESQGISPDRIRCAQGLMGNGSGEVSELLPRNPLEWVKGHWSEVVKEVAQLATQQLRENLEIEVDRRIMEIVEVGETTAEACLETCDSKEEAIKESVGKTQKQIQEILAAGCYSVEKIVGALKEEEVGGDPESALEILQKRAMAEYAARVWISPDKTDNEYFQEAIRTDERSIRMLMVEYNMRSWGRANTAAKLIVQKKFEVDDVVVAAEECGDMIRTKEFLEKECELCYESLPRNKLMSLMNCQCMICRNCVIQHFEIIAKDTSIMKGKCPVCDLPELDELTVTADYFAFLDILLRELLDDEVYALFQQKLRDWNLMQNQDFCWCAHCNSGFINGAPDRRKMRCPECNKLTCFHCKKQWLDQHEGISCEQFQLWKENNDPDLQAQGLAAHLNENGIECPRCKMRYELAKGGCMHFKCPQCTFEFCCGCNEPMKKGEACGKLASCGNKGLHAHHPRACLFYLRDESIEFLQKLLQNADIQFNKEPPQGADENEEGKCGVKEQKDGPNGLVDDKCGRKVSPVNAGLCRIHYTEYLVGLINTNTIDPAKAFTVEQLQIILKREEIPVPMMYADESNPDFRRRLVEEVQLRLPLTKNLARERPR